MASYHTMERMFVSAGCSCPISDFCPVTSCSRPQSFHQSDGERRRSNKHGGFASSPGVWARGGHPRKPLKKQQSSNERPKGTGKGQMTVEKRPPSVGGERRRPPGVNNGKAELAALKVKVPGAILDRGEGAPSSEAMNSAQIKLEHFVGVWGPQNKAPLGLETEEERELRMQLLDKEERERLREEMLRYGPAFGQTELTGQHRQALSGQLSTFLWSSAAEETGYKHRAVRERTLAYERAVDAMAPKRTRFFFVFVRHIQRRTIPAPWDDWTLVAQLAVESEEAVDTSALPGQLAAREHALVAECVQWCRPDIILRRRPQYKIRVEEQEPFFCALPRLLTPSLGADYYEHICSALALSTSASLEQVETAYQRLTAGARSQLLEIIFTGNSGNPLHELVAEVDGAGKGADGGSIMVPQVEGGGWSVREEADLEGKWEFEEDESEELFDVEGEAALNEGEARFGDESEDEMSDDEEGERESRSGRRDEFDVDVLETEGGLRVAIRPFDYLNLLKEIVFVRDFVASSH